MEPVDKIRAALDELKTKAKIDRWLIPESKWCLTMQVRDTTTKGDPFWLQVMGDSINFQYLDDDEPLSRLASEVEGFSGDRQLEGWEPLGHVTFGLEEKDEQDLPYLIDRIFRQYFALDENYTISHSVEDFG